MHQVHSVWQGYCGLLMQFSTAITR